LSHLVDIEITDTLVLLGLSLSCFGKSDTSLEDGQRRKLLREDAVLARLVHVKKHHPYHDTIFMQVRLLVEFERNHVFQIFFIIKKLVIILVLELLLVKAGDANYFILSYIVNQQGFVRVEVRFLSGRDLVPILALQRRAGYLPHLHVAGMMPFLLCLLHDLLA